MSRTFPIIDLAAAESAEGLAPAAIREIIRRAADYQLKLQADDMAFPKNDINFEWVRGAFYTGIPAAYEATGDAKYLEAAVAYSTGRKWQLDKPDTRHADWQCVGQLYVELYLSERDSAKRDDPAWIDAIKRNIDAQIADPKPGRVDWWWCDALYMAPPVLTRLYAATSDTKYLAYLDTMYWDAHDFLYNEQEHLFYRDKNFFDARTKNGREVYWSRGNGWVLAGLARLMDYLPMDDPGRPKFEKLFRNMSHRIADLQGDDGLWRTSLLDSEDFPTAETSGSAFFTYAMAWGINKGLLARDELEPIVKKGWLGLARAVTPAGKLGYVQGVADAPGEVKPEDTREYAVGALLQAGNELLKLQKANDRQS